MSEVKLPLLLKELRDVDWKAFGRAIGTPEPIIQAILQQNPHNISRCWIDLMDHWMDNSEDVSWAAVAKTLEKIFQKPHADRIIRKYCIRSSTMQTDGANGDVCDPKSIEVHGDVEEELVQLNLHFSEMIKKVRNFVSGRLNRSFRRRSRRNARQSFTTYVATYLGKDTHSYSCIDKVLDDLCSLNADLFKVKHLKTILKHYFEAISSAIVDEISVYEYRVECFMKHVRISQLKERVIQALPNAATDKCDTLSIVLSHEWNSVTWNLLEKLMKKVFRVHDNILIHPIVTTGSVKVRWSFREDFKTELIALANESIRILEQSDVIELSIGGVLIYPQKKHSDVIFQEQLELCEVALASDLMAIPPFMTVTATHNDDDVHMIRKTIDPDWDIHAATSVGLTTSGDVPVLERSFSRTIDEEYCSIDFQCYLESMNPKYETCTIKEHIDIVCPFCQNVFVLEESSCIDHLKCLTCNHEFCGSCCELYRSVKDCKQTSSCNNNSVHVHHNHDYCSYLHELPIDGLEKILTDKHIHYQSYFNPAIPSEKECSNTCKKTRDEAHGICSLHYKIYLIALLKENGINISEELAKLVVQTSPPADVSTTCSVI